MRYILYLADYFYIFRPVQTPQKACPRKGVIHEKATLGGLSIESTITKTARTRRFGMEQQ